MIASLQVLKKSFPPLLFPLPCFTHWQTDVVGWQGIRFEADVLVWACADAQPRVASVPALVVSWKAEAQTREAAASQAAASRRKYDAREGRGG